MNVEKVRRQLESAGFNLFSILDSAALDSRFLPDSSQSLILIGAAGTELWRQMPAGYLERDDPVDEYSYDAVDNILLQETPREAFEILFPANSVDALALPLQKLGEMAGWHNPSPLGHGINQKFGLWFAYRAIVSVSRRLPVSGLPDQPSPCMSCSDTPCLSSCPASALTIQQSPDLKSCVLFRSGDASPCAHTCLARRSCPVAPQLQYTEEQMTYYYRRSLPSLVKWVLTES